jgi:hypothetical protein
MKDLRKDRNKILRSFRLSKIVLVFFWELPWLVVRGLVWVLDRSVESRNLRVFFKARQSLPHVTAIVEQPAAKITAKVRTKKGRPPIFQPPSTTSDQPSRQQSIRPPPEILSIELLLTNKKVSSDTERPAIQLLVWGCWEEKRDRRRKTRTGPTNRHQLHYTTPRNPTNDPVLFKNDTHDILQTYDHEFTSLIIARSMLPRGSRVFLRFSNWPPRGNLELERPLILSNYNARSHNGPINAKTAQGSGGGTD